MLLPIIAALVRNFPSLPPFLLLSPLSPPFVARKTEKGREKGILVLITDYSIGCR
jgi:hypothetical protein